MTDTDVVGWGAARALSDAPMTVSRAIAMRLLELGVKDGFGVLGGGIAPFAAGVDQTALRFHSFHHEAGAGFAAIEAHHASQRPTLVVVTTGPGLVNAMNAMHAARIDGAKLLLVSGLTSAPQRGRGAVQETTTQALASDWYRAGPLFHLAATPEHVDEVGWFFGKLAAGFARPGAFVAHLALPLALQTQLTTQPLPATTWQVPLSTPSNATLDAVLARLRDPQALLWLGHGAQPAATALRAFVEAARLPVLTSPRAKGVLHDGKGFHVGMTGAGGGKAARAFCVARPPTHTLVIGSRLSEVTSFFSADLAPRCSFVHVDVDADAFGAAYPGVSGLGVVSDAAVFVDALAERAAVTGFYADRAAASAGVVDAIATARALELKTPVVDDDAGHDAVDPHALMAALQEVVVDQSDAVVMSESGTSFTWCNARLRFASPGRYRTSAAWGSMGHATAGAVGAALAGDRVVVAVVGDGAALMNNEINTAVHYGARVVWVVLNDAQLGLNEHGMRALGMRPVETQFPRTDFVAFAKSQGADGVAVSRADGLRAALRTALAAGKPFVVDVTIDRSVPSPVVADRIAMLRRQSAGARA